MIVGISVKISVCVSWFSVYGVPQSVYELCLPTIYDLPREKDREIIVNVFYIGIIYKIFTCKRPRGNGKNRSTNNEKNMNKKGKLLPDK